VREPGNLLERALVRCRFPVLELVSLERLAVQEALRRVNGNRTHAARLLGISLRTLQQAAWISHRGRDGFNVGTGFAFNSRARGADDVKIFDATLKTLENALDVRLVEQNVLAGNVANADTPGYKPKELDFSTAMAAARADDGAGSLTTTEAGHMGANGQTMGSATSVSDVASSLVIDGKGTSPGFDGNAVDLDRTMAGMAENGLQYGAGAKAAGKKLAILKYAIDGGS
jgi:flagellar basal-body rod protein FlgB